MKFKADADAFWHHLANVDARRLDATSLELLIRLLGNITIEERRRLGDLMQKVDVVRGRIRDFTQALEDARDEAERRQEEP